MENNMKTITMLVHKLRHSHAVAQHCRELALALEKDEDFVMVAELMGYVHDIGSMQEIIDTGKWFHVCDHGSFACCILSDIELFGTIPPEYALMFDAIKLHNKPVLEDDHNELLKILRDADKLAILEYIVELIDAGKLEWLCETFYESTITPKQLCKDLVPWFEDINYRWTRSKMVDLGIFGKFAEFIG
jgi:hypothetical protein